MNWLLSLPDKVTPQGIPDQTHENNHSIATSTVNIVPMKYKEIIDDLQRPEFLGLHVEPYSLLGLVYDEQQGDYLCKQDDLALVRPIVRYIYKTLGQAKMRNIT